MMKGKERENQKGITLIALVITIVVLLILAGVTLNLVFNGGIINKSQTAVDTYSEESAKEKVKLMISEWRMENIINRTSLDDYLMKSEYEEKRQAYGATNVDKEGNEYIVTIDKKYDVTINAENPNSPQIGSVDIVGKRYMVSTKIGDYTFDETVDIEIEVTAPSGETIKNIEILSGTATVKQNLTGAGTQTAKIIYTVSANGKYSFKATSNNNNVKEKNFEINVNRLLDAPILNEDAIIKTINSIEIDMNKFKSANNYPDNANMNFKFLYKLNTETEFSEMENNKLTGLTFGNIYKLKARAYLSENNYLESVNAIECPVFPTPKMSFSDIKSTSFKINIILDSQIDTTNITYKYYVNSTEKTAGSSTDNICNVTGMTVESVCNVKTIIYLSGNKLYELNDTLKLNSPNTDEVFEYCRYNNNMTLFDYGFQSVTASNLEWSTNDSTQYGGGHGAGKEYWSWSIKLDSSYFKEYSSVKVRMWLAGATYERSTANGYVTVYYKDGTNEQVCVASGVVNEANYTKELVFNKEKEVDYLLISSNGYDNIYSSSSGYVNGIWFSK